jgi:D-alanyl-lipoteichoic acid acyltransferase DltB (MBOAT superfamily)
MLFQSQPFVLIFLPLVVLAYYAGAHSARWREYCLLAASLVFYGWWDVRFVPLLLGQIGVTWILAGVHGRLKAKWPLILGIVLNLASLGTFKYLNFVLTSLAGTVGWHLDRFDIVLPIGISFFTFQLISYLVDRMRGDAPLYPLRRFALFVMFFPHLIAGPIVRHNELIPQFDKDPLRKNCDARIALGLIVFTVGFAKKVLLADRLADDIVNPIFELAAGGHALTFGQSWSAVLGFSMQIFLDFSAYTDMAIGAAMLFGLLLPENFLRPYFSTDIREFWRRWHMTLSRFLRDYLYFPLGGSRHGSARFVFATIVTMALCGLWHGAGWTFVVWGLWHGVGLVVCRGWKSLGKPLPSAAGWLLTMAFVVCGWVVFRAPDFSTALSVFGAMTGVHGVAGSPERLSILLEAAAACLLIPSSHEIPALLERNGLRPAMAVAMALVAAFCVLEVGKGVPAEFIYFRF